LCPSVNTSGCFYQYDDSKNAILPGFTCEGEGDEKAEFVCYGT